MGELKNFDVKIIIWSTLTRSFTEPELRQIAAHNITAARRALRSELAKERPGHKIAVISCTSKTSLSVTLMPVDATMKEAG